MTAYKFPLARSNWDHSEYQAIQSVISSGMFSMGVNVQAFESHAAEYFGSKYCVMVNSGSSANLLMIAALVYTKNPDLSIKRGDEVIVPAVSWGTTYFPLHQHGLKMIFVDVDLETLNYDLDQLQEAVTDRTRMIVAVNILGNPNRFDRIAQIIDKEKIILVEDNCESMGAEYEGRKTGTFGVMGTGSCFFSHHISTMEGGFITTDDEEIYHILLSLRAHGWTRQLPDKNHVLAKQDRDDFLQSFQFVLPGYNVRPLELSGAIGVEQLKKLPDGIQKRRENAINFKEVMKNNRNLMIQKEIGKSSWFGFTMVIQKNAGMSRTDLVKTLTNNGFECRPIVGGNIVRSEVIKYFDYEVFGSLDNANHIHENGLYIGNHAISMDDALDQLGNIC